MENYTSIIVKYLHTDSQSSLYFFFWQQSEQHQMQGHQENSSGFEIFIKLVIDISNISNRIEVLRLNLFARGGKLSLSDTSIVMTIPKVSI